MKDDQYCSPFFLTQNKEEAIFFFKHPSFFFLCLINLAAVELCRRWTITTISSVRDVAIAVVYVQLYTFKFCQQTPVTHCDMILVLISNTCLAIMFSFFLHYVHCYCSKNNPIKEDSVFCLLTHSASSFYQLILNFEEKNNNLKNNSSEGSLEFS